MKINKYGMLATRIEMIYHTLNELSGRTDIGLVTGSDEVYFENMDTQHTSRSIDRSTIKNLDSIDLVRVMTGLYNDMPCNCAD